MANKKLNKDKLITFVFILIGFSILSVIGVKVYNDFFKEKVNYNEELARLDLYGYTLDKSDTSIYKKYFKELETVLSEDEINYDDYAELLSKLYIIDLYTLDNKLSGTDVGALEFVYPDISDNFKLNAKNTIYKYVKVNFDGKREQELPEVEDVTVGDIIDISYVYNEKNYEAYKVSCSWTYVIDLGYETESSLTLVKDGTKLYVVESD